MRWKFSNSEDVLQCITIGCMDEGDGAGDVDGDNYYGDLQKAGQFMMVMVMKKQ